MMSEMAERLMDAAESSMRSRGYHAVSFRELADELGIKSASVHYYFPQKEDLGLALVTRYFERFFIELSKNAARAKTPHEKLTAFCNTYRASLKSSDKLCLCGMLGAETCGLPEALGREVSGFFAANIDWVMSALPAEMTKKTRREMAVQTVSTVQGAMMLATSMKESTIFDAAASALLSNYSA